MQTNQGKERATPMFYWASRIFGTEFNTVELSYLGASILMLHYYGNLCKQIALVFTEPLILLDFSLFIRQLTLGEDAFLAHGNHHFARIELVLVTVSLRLRVNL